MGQPSAACGLVRVRACAWVDVCRGGDLAGGAPACRSSPPLFNSCYLFVERLRWCGAGALVCALRACSRCAPPPFPLASPRESDLGACPCRCPRGEGGLSFSGQDFSTSCQAGGEQYPERSVGLRDAGVPPPPPQDQGAEPRRGFGGRRWPLPAFWALLQGLHWPLRHVAPAPRPWHGLTAAPAASCSPPHPWMGMPPGDQQGRRWPRRQCDRPKGWPSSAPQAWSQLRRSETRLLPVFFIFPCSCEVPAPSARDPGHPAPGSTNIPTSVARPAWFGTGNGDPGHNPGQLALPCPRL